MNPYAPPAMVPPTTAITRASGGGRDPATSVAVMKAPRPPMRNCPSTPRLNRPAWNDTARPRPAKMNGVALTRVSEMGRRALAMSSAFTALDRGHDATRVADRPGDHRRVALDHAGERAADRCERIRADLLQVLEVGQHDDDRTQEERGEHRECRDNGATECIANSLHVDQCRRRAPSASGHGRLGRRPDTRRFRPRR